MAPRPNKSQKEMSRLSIQNKELSTDRNKLLLQILSLTNENQEIKNKNIELTAKFRTISLKHGAMKQTLKECVSALMTISRCVPSVLTNLNEISKLYKLDVKKEKQTKSVSPMVNGLRYCGDINVLPPIRELPDLENTPNRPRKSSHKSSSDVDLPIVSTRPIIYTSTPKVNKINLKGKFGRKK